MRVYVVFCDQVDREIEGIYSSADVAFDRAKELDSDGEGFYPSLVEIHFLDKED